MIPVNTPESLQRVRPPDKYVSAAVLCHFGWCETVSRAVYPDRFNLPGQLARGTAPHQQGEESYSCL